VVTKRRKNRASQKVHFKLDRSPVSGEPKEEPMKTFVKLCLPVLAVSLLSLGPGSAHAAGFPDKPITIIVHAAAGGGSDIFARTLAAANDKDKFFPQPVVVENKPGGSGAIAFAYVAGKKKDPYFVVTAVTSFLTTPLQGRSPISYKEFTPIANFAFDEYMMMVNTNSKYKSIKDVVAAAKANPQKITVGGTQLGSSDSICAYLIEKAAGIKLNYVVFNSGGEVNAALLGGHIDLAVSNPGEALELMKANKVRLLGVFAEKRLAGAPEIPTMKEQGLDTIYVQNRGLCAPAGIPDDARKVLEEGFLKYYKSEAFKKYCKDNLLTEAWMDGATFGKWLDQENARYAVMLKDMGLIKK
jgi:putative tricarboxylic transport membrane protein